MGKDEEKQGMWGTFFVYVCIVSLARGPVFFFFLVVFKFLFHYSFLSYSSLPGNTCGERQEPLTSKVSKQLLY